MFAFIERFLARIVTKALTPELLVRVVSRDALVAALNSKNMRALIVDEMVDNIDMKHLAQCFDTEAIALRVCEVMGPSKVAREFDLSDIAEYIEVDTDSIEARVVERAYEDCTFHDDDVIREIVSQWNDNNGLDMSDVVREIIMTAYRGL